MDAAIGPTERDAGTLGYLTVRGVTLAQRGGDPVGVHSPALTFTYAEVLIAKLGG